MANRRLVGGVLLIGIGVLVMGLSSLGGLKVMLASIIYSMPLIVIGLVILLNKRADKIEEINYSKIKRRK